MPELSPPKQRFPATLLIRISVGIALLAFLFTRHADIGSVSRLIRNASLPWVIFAIFLSASGEVITAYKWRRLIAHIGGNLPILKAIRASFIGMFYNNFFPGSVGGDIIRVLLVSREAGGKARATASAFMQRNTGLAGLFVVGLPATFLWPRHIQLPANIPLPPLLTDTRFLITFALAGYTATNALLFNRTAYHRLWQISDYEESHLPANRIHRVIRIILRKLQRFHAELHGYSFWLPLPLAISAFTQMIDIVLVFTLGQALGISVTLPLLMTVVTLVSLGNLIPVTVNGIGLRETLYVSLLASASIPANQAIALSLCHFSVIMLMAAVGGLLQLLAAKQ